MRLMVRGPSGEIAAALRQVPGVQQVEIERQQTANDHSARFIVMSRAGRDLREELAATVVRRNWGLLELQPMGMSLEEIFLQLTTKEED